MTTAELAVLSLLAERPMHGYALGHVIDDRGMREWVDLGLSSIYDVLRRLQRRGMVFSETDSTSRGPKRKAFGVTAEGRAALADGLVAALRELPPPHSPFLLGLANTPSLPGTDVAEALAARLETLEHERMRLSRIREALGGRPTHVDAMFDYSLTLITAELEWLARFTSEKR